MAESYSIQAVLSAVDQNFTSTLREADQSTEQLSEGMDKTNVSILDIAKGVGVFKVLDMAINATTQAVSGAIDRFDTLNQYPKVLESLGASGEEAASSMEILKNGVDGLPTRLDDVASTSQAMFMVFKDADYAAESTIALNNALLASGSSSEEAAQGTDAYLKMLRAGKVDAQNWNTLNQTMGVTLEKTAEYMLGAGASSTELYTELQAGTISLEDFNNGLIKVNEGFEGYDGSAAVAKEATKGIGTSIKNLNTTFVNGVTKIITATNEMIGKITGSSEGIADILGMLKVVVGNTFDAIASSISMVTPLIVVLGKVMMETISPTTLWGAALQTLAVAIVGVLIVAKAKAAFEAFSITLFAYKNAAKFGATATEALSVAQSVNAKQAKLVGVVTSVTTGIEKASAVVKAVLTGQTNLLTIATKLLTVAWQSMLLPIGLVIAAVTAAIKVFQWATKDSRELKKAHEELSDQMTDSAEAYGKSTDTLEKQKEANEKLMQSIVSLSEKENLSMEERAKLDAQIQEMNNSVEGLNLAYGEEENGLNMTTEAMKKRLDMDAKIQEGNAARERSVELTTELSELEELYGKSVEINGEKHKKTKELLGEIDEKKKEMIETTKLVDEAERASANLVNLMVTEQKVNYNDLSETQKAAFDSMFSQYQKLQETVTNVFDAVEQKQEISMDQMIENLRENQKAMAQWSDNITLLAELGVNQGIVKQLEAMGPAGAKQTQVLVDTMTDGLGKLTPAGKQKMDELNGTLTSGMNEITFGMAKIAGEGSEPIVAAMHETSVKSMESLRGGFKDSELAEIGKNINEGIAKGLGNSEGNVKEAAKNSADKLNESYKAALDINSPSGVMMKNGDFVIQGLVKGMEQGENKVTSISDKLANVIPKAFDFLENDLYSIGQQAMMGFANGINQSGEVAISNANRIANDVANTMRKALDEHSPSRVMKQIGEFVGEGLAIGIEKSSKLVQRAVSVLNNDVMGLAGVNGSSNLVSGFNQKIDNSNDNNVPLYVTVESILDGKVVSKEVAPYMATDLQNINSRNNTSLGRR